MTYSKQIMIDYSVAERVANVLASGPVPSEQEAAGHSFLWAGTNDELANAYLAVVAICHQTSPIGERPLQGMVNGQVKVGWDYLKEKFLVVASENRDLCSPELWTTLTPYQLSSLYRDADLGMTLNRVNERTYLLNDLGRFLLTRHIRHVRQAFEECGRRIDGETGVLKFLSQVEAYSDPVRKKSLFFLSLACNECGWIPDDPDTLQSPIDYHELRGHLRIGTILVQDPALLAKLNSGVPISIDEDRDLRLVAQDINNWIADRVKITNSMLHYLLWNLFRNCCPRASDKTHCSGCSGACQLPQRYRRMGIERCMFHEFCKSAGLTNKISEPPYIGHYY